MRERLDAAAFQQATDVSRETLARLEVYAGLLEKWQRRINLVSRATVPDLWSRHMLDSAQLAPVVGEAGEVAMCLDMGTGAGFPGMVLAIMGLGRWTLVDSDERKIAFLREVARQTETEVTFSVSRLEGLENLQADIVTARACAPLAVLLGYAAPLMHADSTAIFLKGKGVTAELEAARKEWVFTCETRASETDTSGTILVIQDVRRA